MFAEPSRKIPFITGLHPYLPELSPDQAISVPIPEHCSGMSSNTAPEPHYVSGPFTGKSDSCFVKCKPAAFLAPLNT